MPLSTSSPLRLGLIGCGYVSKYHVASARALGLPVTAVCDRADERVKEISAQTGAQTFTSVAALIASKAVDAVIVATPHLHHAAIAIEALDAGLHVLVEKPLTVAAAEAAKVLAVANQRPQLVCAVNFNHRAWPLWRAIKRILHAGELGVVTRFQWTITEWYRTQRYYEQSAWRGTWAGEGGGLLVNQCPHQLDVLCWFFGLPRRVLANVRFGKHHHIEVEDEVHAIFDYTDGLTGCFIASTGEPCGENRLEIVGDRGIISVAGETSFVLTRFDVSAREHTAMSSTRHDPPPHATQTIRVDDHDDEYVRVLANFAAACRGEAEPLASAASAMLSVELANAIVLAGMAGSAINVPAAPVAFAQLLDRLRVDEAKERDVSR